MLVQCWPTVYDVGPALPTIGLPNVGSLLAHRLRRWPNIAQLLGCRLIFTWCVTDLLGCELLWRQDAL